jgi:hypothetical protein
MSAILEAPDIITLPMLVLACAWCHEAVSLSAIWKLVPVNGHLRLMPYHAACAHRATFVPGLNHLKRLCACYGGTAPADPPDLSLREAADEAVRYWCGQLNQPLRE